MTINPVTKARAGGYTDTHGYDGAGNPTTFQGVSQSFNSNNQLVASGYAFDGNGNATTYAGATLAYDPENRLKQFNATGVSKWFKWRADGLKAWDHAIASTNATAPAASTGTYYFYDGGNAVLETSSSGTINAVNVFAPDGLVARKEGSNWKYYQFDQQDNAVYRSNSSGGRISTACYNAWGKAFTAPVNGDTFRYNARWGYRYDSDLQMYLCQHRYYDAGQGRWLNRDPIGYAGGVNLYGYCESGPVGVSDQAGWAKVFLCRTYAAADNWHAVIVITDGNNPYKRAVVAEAGPDWNALEGGGALGNLRGSSRNDDNYLVGDGEERLSDNNTVDYWHAKIKSIIPAKVTYWLFPFQGCGGGNSNSWARECLERMGIDSSYPEDGTFPGWEADPWDNLWHTK